MVRGIILKREVISSEIRDDDIAEIIKFSFDVVDMQTSDTKKKRVKIYLAEYLKTILVNCRFYHQFTKHLKSSSKPESGIKVAE